MSRAAPVNYICLHKEWACSIHHSRGRMENVRKKDNNRNYYYQMIDNQDMFDFFENIFLISEVFSNIYIFLRFLIK